MSTRSQALRGLVILLGGAVGAIGVACSDDTPGAGLDSETRGPGAYCAVYEPGCACDREGAVTPCGEVVQRTGDYVSCSEGTMTCTDGRWSACLGERVTTKSAPEGELTALGLQGDAGACANPCAPDCKQFADNPPGLALSPDAGLTIVDGGLTPTGVAVSGVPCTSLVVTPDTAPTKDLSINVSAVPPSPSTKTFTASLLPAGCYTGPVSALWSVDKYDVAQIANGLMTVVTPIAGPVTVRAFAGTLSDTVVSNVTVNVVDTSAAPAGYAGAFTATTGTADTDVEILYPYANTVFPLGLAPPIVQWRDNRSSPPTANAVKITLRYPAASPIFQWSMVIPEKTTAPTPSLPAQRRGFIPADVWFAFSQTVARNAATYGDTAVFAVQRAFGTPPRAEVTRPIRFASGQLKGKVLYNSYGTNLVQNYGNTRGGARFGAATLSIPPNGSAPSVVAGYTSAANGPGCRVCHSVSADGDTLATNRFQPNDQTSSAYDLSTSPISESLLGASTGNGTFTWPALSTDGSYLFTNAGPGALQGTNTSVTSRLYRIDGSTLSATSLPTNLKAATPAFAHDMSAVAFNWFAGNTTPLAAPASPTTGDGQSIAMMSFNPATRTFSNFKVLYDAPGSGGGTGTAMWPSFLPAGQNGVVFHRELRYNTRDFGGTRSDCDGTGACNGQGTTAEIWWSNTAGAATPTRLDKLNGRNAGTSYLPTGPNLHGNPANATFNDNVYNYEPTVLPTTAGGYSWVVFTSRRMYGNIATINPFWSDPRYQFLDQEPTPKKLWVAAISQNPTAGTDPSNPAFYLPGQELLAGNSRGYFVLESCRQPGPISTATECETTADCCQSPTASVCQIDPPPLTNPPKRHCISAGSSACKADGQTCGADLECCNFGAGSRCASGVCAAPPPIVSYGNPKYTRLYASSCKVGSAPTWRFFDWKSDTPVGTSIVFRARTGPNAGSFGAPVTVGTAQAPPAVTPTWTSAPITVDQALRAAGQRSDKLLSVEMEFISKTTAPTAAPVLYDWRVAFDCVPNE